MAILLRIQMKTLSSSGEEDSVVIMYVRSTAGSGRIASAAEGDGAGGFSECLEIVKGAGSIVAADFLGSVRVT